MATSHPHWCARAEAAGEDHISDVMCAAEPTDCADIRLRMEELTCEDTSTTLLFLEFMEDEETQVYPLPLAQAHRLWAAMGRLLTPHPN